MPAVRTYAKAATRAKSSTKTPQTQPIPGSDQKQNHAGGYSFVLDDWKRLDRFLILGSEGGTYYQSERKLTRENATVVLRCLKADPLRLIGQIVAISQSGRAPKNDPCLMALALATTSEDPMVKRAAFDVLPLVARTGTHLLHFIEYMKGFRGTGRSFRNGVGRWYNQQEVQRLAYQLLKYQNRDGWAQRDVFRQAHPNPGLDESRKRLYHWVTRGWDGVGDEPHDDPNLVQVWAMERAKRAQSADEVAALIREYRLPREAVPTTWLNKPEIWRALLEVDMPLGALIRNLATLTRHGLLGGSDTQSRKLVLDALADREKIAKARIHPIAALSALKTYAAGQGLRGQHTWEPDTKVVDALDAMFYTAFGNIEPTHKRHLLALDVSGSMTGGVVGGVQGLTPNIASAAMSLVTAASESDTMHVAFHNRITKLDISPRQRLDDVAKKIANLNAGGTDCSLPMLWALEQKQEFEAFVVYTDNETWAGRIHPSQALKQYREKTGIAAKLIVVGMTSTGFTIADPSDAGMMDVVGFDSAAPAVMADFTRN